MSRRPRRSRAAALRRALWGLLLPACLAAAPAAPPGPQATEPALPAPVLDGLEPPVRETLAEARAHLEALVAAGGLDDGERAEAYGELGRLYHAHDVHPPAEAAYRRAIALAPETFRWRYYLADLLRRRDALAEAAEVLREALPHGGDYPALPLVLGETLVDLDEVEAAVPHLERAAADPELAAAARAALGRAALARRDFAEARRQLEAALAAAPEAGRLRVPLAMAARGLGDLEAARRHLAARGNRDPDHPDPLLDRLPELMGGARTHYYHAMAAVHARRFDLAIDSFRAGLDRDPGNADARVSLARALYLEGDPEAAEAELRHALADAPDHALGHLLLGVLLEHRGAGAEALGHYRRSLEAEPDHAGARHHLGLALLRRGDPAGAAAHLAEAARLAPGNVAAALHGAAAAAAAGAISPEIVAGLRALRAAHPEDPRVDAALARALACAPGEGAPEEAVRLARGLFQAQPVYDHAEVLALAQAAAGAREDARALQENALDAAFRSGRPDLVARATDLLEAIAQGSECAEPWHPLDPLRAPALPAPGRVFLDYPADEPY